jgi:ATP-dependent Lon protease
VSAAGGELLPVEVLRVEGQGRLIVTGRVGRALQESASLAQDFWKSRAAAYGVDPDALIVSDFHLHLPGGQVPKEGTSAGLAIALAFGSLLAGVNLPDGLAALGEITLHGRVLAVDDLPARLAAAQRADVKHVLLPERNRPGIEHDEGRHVPEGLRLTFVDSVSDALQVALPGMTMPRKVGA